jgi:translation initiation factor eIF-2B subunit gamma
MYVYVQDDFIEGRETLFRAPEMKLYTQLQDAHVYLMKLWVLDFALESDTMCSSLRGDVIPFLIKSQFSQHPTTKTHYYATKDGGRTVTTNEEPLLSISSLHRNPSVIECHVHILREGHYCARANTTASYAEINRQLCRGASKRLLDIDKTPLVHPSTEIRGSIGRDCMVGEGSRLGEHSILKRSVIGKHCMIGKNVKIANSVLLDYVVVEDK